MLKRHFPSGYDLRVRLGHASIAYAPTLPDKYKGCGYYNGRELLSVVHGLPVASTYSPRKSPGTLCSRLWTTVSKRIRKRVQSHDNE